MQKSPAPAQSPSAYSRQKRLFEIAVISFGFVLLPVLQGLLLSPGHVDSVVRQTSNPLAGLGFAWQLLLLVFILNTSMPRLLRIPEYWRFKLSSLGRGLLLAMVLLGVAMLLSYSLPHHKQSVLPFQRPLVWLDYLPIASILILSVGLEELLFRVYYLERLVSLGAGKYRALAVAVPLFAIGHQYQGINGIVMAAVLGTILSLAWLRWKNYWVNCLGHLLYNSATLALAFLRQ